MKIKKTKVKKNCKHIAQITNKKIKKGKKTCKQIWKEI